MLILNRRDGKSGTPLSELSEGTLIKIPENNRLVEFYLSKHNYEPGLNGNGRTLVVRKDCYNRRAWFNGHSINAWARCTMRSWLNSNYKALLDADIQEAMSTTTYRYTPGDGNWSVGTRSDAVFLLSATELGESESWFNVEGSALPIASTLQVAHLNGSATTQWTRSPVTWPPVRTDLAVYLLSDGGVDKIYCSNSNGSRPVFTLPSTTPIDPDTMEVIA